MVLPEKFLSHVILMPAGVLVVLENRRVEPTHVHTYPGLLTVHAYMCYCTL